MAEFKEKLYLDEAGLKLYDELIKEYIDKGASKDQEAIDEILATLVNLSETVTGNSNAIEVLNGDADVEGSVKNTVTKAITDLVDGADDAFDTLKEIAEWIQSPEGGEAFDAANRIVGAEEAIEELKADNEDLKAYVDAQDLAVYNSIGSLEDLKIAALFPIKQAEDETVADAIAALGEGKAIKLNEEQTIEEDLTINKSCYIDANGSTFTGTVTVPANADVIIENAVFSKPVVMA